MAEVIRDFALAVPRDEVSASLFHAARLGTFFHTVERTEGEANEAKWHLKTAFRATLGAPYLSCRVTERAGDRCSWEAESTHLHWRGEFVLVEVAPGQTQVHLALRIEDTGPLAAVHNAMIGVQIHNVAKLFEAKVREVLEAKRDA
ncbi:MAG: hypothetical protein ONB23_06525 [candidate division KSB1 bacterium]|nr:hypothetical protein [candidate division KSB1 bacterium]